MEQNVLKVMIDMTVQEPWTSIISYKPNSDIIPSHSRVNGVSANWVEIVVRAAAGTSNNMELVL
jgi:hypothetical protein